MKKLAMLLPTLTTAVVAGSLLPATAFAASAAGGASARAGGGASADYSGVMRCIRSVYGATRTQPGATAGVVMSSSGITESGGLQWGRLPSPSVIGGCAGDLRNGGRARAGGHVHAGANARTGADSQHRTESSNPTGGDPSRGGGRIPTTAGGHGGSIWSALRHTHFRTGHNSSSYSATTADVVAQSVDVVVQVVADAGVQAELSIL